MKRILFFLWAFSMPSYAGPLFGEDQEVPPVFDDPVLITPAPAPKPLPPDNQDLRRVPWTLKGGQFLIEGVRQFCQNGGLTTCESVKPNSGQNDTGVKVYKDGQYLFTFDRAIAEEVQQDYAISQAKAEEHQPYSMYVARKEAEKSNLEYWAIACNSGFGPYCGGMAAKLQKFKDVVLVGCASALAICQKWVRDEQAKIQKEIDRVLAACKVSDQACFDAITGGQETQARAQAALEKSGGERPPHTPTRAGYRPQFMPGRPTTDAMWDKSCEHCKTCEGEEAEDF